MPAKVNKILDNGCFRKHFNVTLTHYEEYFRKNTSLYQ